CRARREPGERAGRYAAVFVGTGVHDLVLAVHGEISRDGIAGDERERQYVAGRVGGSRRRSGEQWQQRVPRIRHPRRVDGAELQRVRTERRRGDAANAYVAGGAELDPRLAVPGALVEQLVPAGRLPGAEPKRAVHGDAVARRSIGSEGGVAVRIEQLERRTDRHVADRRAVDRAERVVAERREQTLKLRRGGRARGAGQRPVHGSRRDQGVVRGANVGQTLIDAPLGAAGVDRHERLSGMIRTGAIERLDVGGECAGRLNQRQYRALLSEQRDTARVSGRRLAVGESLLESRRGAPQRLDERLVVRLLGVVEERRIRPDAGKARLGVELREHGRARLDERHDDAERETAGESVLQDDRRGDDARVRRGYDISERQIEGRQSGERPDCRLGGRETGNGAGVEGGRGQRRPDVAWVARG